MAKLDTKTVFQVCTTYFHETDRDLAEKFGAGLYNHLTRPSSDAIAPGGGIPVWVACADSEVPLWSARKSLVVPVLGTQSFTQETTRKRVTERIAAWRRSRAVVVVPVLTSESWRNLEADLPQSIKRYLFEKGDSKYNQTLIELVLAALRALDRGHVVKSSLFISHAKADLKRTGAVASKMLKFVKNHTTANAFFDATSLEPGGDLREQLDRHSKRGVFVLVRGDHYGTRPWCLRELLRAKSAGLPTLTIEVLRSGELRSLPYGGNGPTVVWSRDPEEVTLRAIVEWLKAVYFRLEGGRVAKAAGYGEPQIVCRPPELLDLTQGPVADRGRSVVMHPDPELSVHERTVLAAARPGLKLVTPTTAYRSLLGEHSAAPLRGRRIALSLSNSPDEGGVEGFTQEHVRDATVFLARSLVSAGAEIAYGGHFDSGGYSRLLGEIVRSYNQTEVDESQYLHNYVAGFLKFPKEKEISGLPLTIHLLGDPNDPEGARASLPPPPRGPVPPEKQALYFSDMRRVMAEVTHGRIILGGNSVPKGFAETGGYQGRLSGVLEEAWWTLRSGAPLYVCGGYGGAARSIWELTQSKKKIPEVFKEATYANLSRYTDLAQALDDDPEVERLGLPKTLDALAEDVRSLLAERLADDDSAIAFNGLDKEENALLATTRDPASISRLVLKGLVRRQRDAQKGALSIELVSGSITDVPEVSAIAIATFDNVDMGGAGAALDRAVNGRLAEARRRKLPFVHVEDGDTAAEWILPVDMGKLDDLTDVARQVEDAAYEAATRAVRHGIERLGVVTIGGSVHDDIETVASAMLRGLRRANSGLSIVWCEAARHRFDRLSEILGAADDVALTTLVLPPRTTRPVVEDRKALATLTRRDEQLDVLVIPPGGTAAVSAEAVALANVTLESLRVGAAYDPDGTPPFRELAKRGAELTKILFPEKMQALLARCRDVPLVLVADPETSGLPLETMQLGAGANVYHPALKGGIVRRLAAADADPAAMFARPPPSGDLTVLLIENPTGDLEGAEREAKAVRRVLSGQSVKVVDLVGSEATVEAILERLADDRLDVVHYCGHAFYYGPKETQSGLKASNGDVTLASLRNTSSRPRLAFMNACQSARVRRDQDRSYRRNAQAFAEVFLRAGVEAFIGTFWTVSDDGAELFAREVYLGLVRGMELANAVLAGRKALHAKANADWANYLLFGDGTFRLVR